MTKIRAIQATGYASLEVNGKPIKLLAERLQLNRWMAHISQALSEHIIQHNGFSSCEIRFSNKPIVVKGEFDPLEGFSAAARAMVIMEDVAESEQERDPIFMEALGITIATVSEVLPERLHELRRYMRENYPEHKFQW